MKIQWTSCQTEALHWLDQGQNVFLTGVAGSGKSFTIRHYLAKQDPKKFPILASTGAAAILVGGRTFHSFFGLGIMEGGVEATVQRAMKDRMLRWRINKIEGVIIDEVSMLSGPTLAAAEKIARTLREKDEPWGGLRLVAVGDFAQLPPVSRFDSQKEWAFEDPVWERSAFYPVVLRTICRTQDKSFSSILNKARNGIVDEELTDFLESRRVKSLEGITASRLFPRREQTDKFNMGELAKLKGEQIVLPTTYSGRENLIATLKKNAPIPESIILKVGALVMIRQNDPKGRFVNGSLGFVRSLKGTTLNVELLNGIKIELEKISFSMMDANGEVVAAATNYPLMLAWATTIHKSQGATLDAAVVNLKGLWEPGQAYVALSRVRSPDQVYVEDWSANSFKISPEVVQFHDSIGF